MPNVAQVLKAEISRIARKEAKAAVAPIRKPSVKLRKGVAALKTRLTALEKECKRLAALVVEGQARAAAAPEEGGARVRITAKGMRSLRRKLRLSQSDFARLLDVSDQTIYNWEKKSGALKVREQTRCAIVSVRDFGARDARKQLAEKAQAKKAAAKRGRKRR